MQQLIPLGIIWSDLETMIFAWFILKSYHKKREHVMTFCITLFFFHFANQWIQTECNYSSMLLFNYYYSMLGEVTLKGI